MIDSQQQKPISVWGILLFLVLFVMFVGQLQAHDLWWHLQAGGVILRDMAVPRVDVFSFTATGTPWIYHSWLGGVILRATYECGGLWGLIFLRSAVFALSLAIAGAVARSRGVSRVLMAVLLLGCAFQLQSRALMRPYAFSFLFFALFYYHLQKTFQSSPPEEASKWSFMWGSRGRLLVLPILMVLWANVHGGFHVGLLLFGAYGVAEMVRVAAEAKGKTVKALLFHAAGVRFRAYLWTGVICLSVTLFNPYGAAVLTYPIRLLMEVSFMARIVEWQPVQVDANFVVFWGMAGMLGICFFRSFRVARARDDALRHLVQLLVDLMVAGGFFLLALRSVRNISWFLLVVPSILGYHLGIMRHIGNRVMNDRRRLVYGWLACVTAGVLCMWHIGRLKMRLVGKSFPDNAVQYMAENAVPGPTYNVYEWGGYLIWQRWPERRVFIDGRCLVYGDEVIEESFRVAKGKKGWEDVLDRYEVMSVLLRYDKYKSDHFFEQGQWECIYWDDTALVAVKSGMAERLPRYNVTNPVTFSDALQENPPQIILEELDAVLNLNPTSWRAWMFRAQVLHKQVKEGERVGQETAAAARTAARRAVKLSQSAEEAKGVLEDVERAISSQPVESTEQKD